MLLVLGAVAYSIVHFGPSWGVLREHIWEACAPLAWVASAVIVFHSVGTACGLINTLKAEASAGEEVESHLEHPSGGKFVIRKAASPPRRFRTTIWGISCALIAAASCLFYLFYQVALKVPAPDTNAGPHWPVASEFQHVYASHAAALGQPLGPLKNSAKVYFGVFQHAMGLYVDEFSVLYILPIDLSTRREFSGSQESRGRYFCDEWIKQQLGLSCDPPVAGIASLWDRDKDRDPGRWNWIGCRDWHRLYHEEEYKAQFRHRAFRPVVFQRFQFGDLIGRLSRLRATDPRDDTTQTIGVVRGVTWFSELTSGEPASSVDATPIKQQCDPHTPLW